MPNRYPQEVSLRDGRRVLMRPFGPADTQALWEFFQRLPPSNRRFAWDRIDDREVVENWGRNVDFGRAFPLLALDGTRVVADATLHRRHGGPLRLTGRIKWLIDPDYRGAGLGTTFVNQFINIARENGLRHLSCMLISDLEKDSVETLTALGFKPHVVPGYGTDPDGGRHDMTYLVLEL
ncbi:MAG: GNAT family N-acetyltransferase [Myxococcales bacterium]|nr:GNAT family N-acetyltransferase [Myxococcales bacterium]MCB9577123.1 GNAT family N-acetyltransferase [Polyangiaceae bacterium]